RRRDPDRAHRAEGGRPQDPASLGVRRGARRAARERSASFALSRRLRGMDKRFSRLSRRSLVGVIVGLAFAAAAGVGLAQITSEPSPTASPVSSTPQSTSVQSSTTGHENDFADDANEENDNLEFEQADSDQQTSSTTSSLTTSTSTQQLTSTTAGEAEGAGAGQQKVDVCHVTGNGSSH